MHLKVCPFGFKPLNEGANQFKIMKYSIIIPTYNKLERALMPCLRSVVAHTDPLDVEIIVVSNGCTDGTVDWVKATAKSAWPWHNVSVLEFPEPLGYTKAVNEGIKVAKGEFIVLLNNDTALLEQNKNQWLNTLVAPFEDERVGLTGPMKGWSPAANGWFLIFFCVMIRKAVFDDIGLLDEVFSPGYGEDTDFCLRAEQARWKVLQVPNNDRLYSDPDRKRMIGNFPIWHEGNVTFREFNENDKFLHQNDEILRDRWNPPLIKIFEAKAIEGFMSEAELQWLAIQATKYEKIAEVGSWLGRSTRALLDNQNMGGVVYSVDHWQGSTGEEAQHAQARWGGGDWAYYTFLQNNFSFFSMGKLMPLRMSSFNAAALLKDKGVKLDFVFIDAGHTKEELKEDIKNWLPLIREGGIISGHDYYHENAWPGVKAAVNELLPGFKVVPNTSIWWKMVGKEDTRPRVYDCFPFFNELDVLDIRLAELDSVVDRWVIVECTKSHGCADKPLYFKDNLERYAKYLHKITHIVVDDIPPMPERKEDWAWAIERHQRDSIMRALTDCKDTDIILIGDVDEIPKAKIIRNYVKSGNQRLSCISLRPCYCFMNYEATEPWNWLRILPYSIMKTMTPCQVRYIPNYDLIDDLIINKDETESVFGGWHYSFLGGIEKWIEKLENTAHQEYNKSEFKDPVKLKEQIKAGKDILFRNIEYHWLPTIPSSAYYPDYVNQNWDRFINNQMICTSALLDTF